MTTGSLSSRVALVTGAARGMGRAIAIELAEAGARVAVNDLDAPTLDAVSRDLKTIAAEPLVIGADITDRASVYDMVNAVVDELGSVDVLVNNAGVLRPTKVVDIPESEWDHVVGVNLKGTFLCSQAVVPHMQRRGWGRIINLSSTAGKNVSTVGGAHYTAAKAGVLGFTRHLASEVAGHGITVNAVCPGLIETDMVRTTITSEAVRAYAQSFPIQRLGKPEEVAALVAFLASERAAYITGASLDINGGDLMI